MSARPASSGGSTSPPFLIISCAETSGDSLRSTTITRKPFERVSSTGFGNVTERGEAGGGGVACGACARPFLTQRTLRVAQRAAEKKILRIMLLALLLRRFRQVVQNKSIRIREVLFHNALNVLCGHCLEPREIRVNPSGIAKQHRSLSETPRFSITRLAFAQLIRDELVLCFLQLSRRDRSVLQLLDLGE